MHNTDYVGTFNWWVKGASQATRVNTSLSCPTKIFVKSRESAGRLTDRRYLTGNAKSATFVSVSQHARYLERPRLVRNVQNSVTVGFRDRLAENSSCSGDAKGKKS